MVLEARNTTEASSDGRTIELTAAVLFGAGAKDLRIDLTRASSALRG